MGSPLMTMKWPKIVFCLSLLCGLFAAVSSRRGKVVEVDDDGNLDVTVSRKKWKDQTEFSRSFCCLSAAQLCQGPCNGQSCDAGCKVKCGWIFQFACPTVACGVANPSGCVPATTTATTTTTTTTTTTPGCPADYTTSGSKCFKVFTAVSNWLAALTTCIGEGGTLAKLETSDENTLVQTLLAGEVGWFGLNDVSNEGTFVWADDAALDPAFTNWANNQPDNNGNGQHCVALRADGLWNDAVCGGDKQFVCQKTI